MKEHHIKLKHAGIVFWRSMDFRPAYQISLPLNHLASAIIATKGAEDALSLRYQSMRDAWENRRQPAGPGPLLRDGGRRRRSDIGDREVADFVNAWAIRRQPRVVSPPNLATKVPK
jgi:hypothetical protein